jgi:hypothetical protein
VGALLLHTVATLEPEPARTTILSGRRSTIGSYRIQKFHDQRLACPSLTAARTVNTGTIPDS